MNQILLNISAIFLIQPTALLVSFFHSLRLYTIETSGKTRLINHKFYQNLEKPRFDV